MRVSENEIEIRKETLDNYKVFRTEINEITSFEKRLLCECNIKAMLPVSFEKEGNYYNILYKITGLISLETARKTGRLKADSIRVLFETLLKVYDYIPDYMLKPENVVLTLENVFFDTDFKSVYFMYAPGDVYTEEINKEVIMLAEDIINSVESIDTDTIMYIYTLICELKEENGTLKSAVKRADALSFKTEDIPKVDLQKEQEIVAFDMEDMEEVVKEKPKKKKANKFAKTLMDLGKRKIGDYTNFTPKKHDKYENINIEEFSDYTEDVKADNVAEDMLSYDFDGLENEDTSEILYMA